MELKSPGKTGQVSDPCLLSHLTLCLNLRGPKDHALSAVNCAKPARTSYKLLANHAVMRIVFNMTTNVPIVM